MTTDKANRLIASSTIGNSDTIEADRKIGQSLKNIRWRGFVGTVAHDAITRGFKRLALHNPGGCLSGEEMLASQFLHAKRAGLSWITDGFVEAWKPITERFEVIAYQGSLALDPEVKRAWETSLPGFLDYLGRAYELAIAAGMSLAFDSHQHLNIRHFAVAGARHLMQLAVRRNPKARAYVEPGPAIDQPENNDGVWFGASGYHIWIANHNSAIIHDETQAWQLKTLPPGTETIVQLAVSPAEYIRDCDSRSQPIPVPAEYRSRWGHCEWSNYSTWIRLFIQYHLERGRSVAVNPDDFRRCGLTVEAVI